MASTSRVRTKKRGNLRIDAALDAMKPFGFPPKLVRDTVKDLLTVYGGDDGWIFIEEGSYTLLIDTLLEKQKDGAIEKVDEEHGKAVDHHESSIAGCSSSAIDEGSSSNPEAEITVDNEAFRTTATLPTNDSDVRQWKDGIVSGGDEHCRSSPNQSFPAHIPKIRRRRPYHGWISSNDDREDLVHLTRGPLPEEFARLFIPHDERKRKKRWDVRLTQS